MLLKEYFVQINTYSFYVWARDEDNAFDLACDKIKTKIEVDETGATTRIYEE